MPTYPIHTKNLNVFSYFDIIGYDCIFLALLEQFYWELNDEIVKTLFSRSYNVICFD